MASSGRMPPPARDPAPIREMQAPLTKNDLARRLFGVGRETGACGSCNSSINIISERITDRTRWNQGGIEVESFFSHTHFFSGRDPESYSRVLMRRQPIITLE